MQMTMNMEDCCRCGQPIAPGAPAMHTASVDIVDGRAVSSPVKAYHLSGDCHEDARARSRAEIDALRASLKAAQTTLPGTPTLAGVTAKSSCQSQVPVSRAMSDERRRVSEHATKNPR